MQQKFRFLEIWEIPLAQRNGTLRPNSKVLYRVFGYRTCKQDTEERYSGYNNLANGKEPRRTNQIRPSSKMFPNIPVGPNRNDPFHFISNRNFLNFGLNGKLLSLYANESCDEHAIYFRR